MNQWTDRTGACSRTLAFNPARRALDQELLTLFLRCQTKAPPPKYQPQLHFVPGLIAAELLGYQVVRQ